jgi:excisionase family DNA binding protein
MSKILELQELGCKSTRETAKILQVSLGTIQKMVETGELVAWKTRGGHRRILDQSIERQLEKRLDLLRHFTSKHYSILAIFKEASDIVDFENNCLQFESSIQITSLIDLSEALMKSVEIKPDIIYIDKKVNYIDQYHLMHHFKNNLVTKQIPVLVYQEILNENNPDNDYSNSSIENTINSQKTLKSVYQYSNQFEMIENIIKSALFNRLI